MNRSLRTNQLQCVYLASVLKNGGNKCLSTESGYVSISEVLVTPVNHLSMSTECCSDTCQSPVNVDGQNTTEIYTIL